jgi:hypothetical protein
MSEELTQLRCVQQLFVYVLYFARYANEFKRTDNKTERTRRRRPLLLVGVGSEFFFFLVVGEAAGGSLLY